MPFLGIDIGTGGTRAIIIDEAGRVIATVVQEGIVKYFPGSGSGD